MPRYFTNDDARPIEIFRILKEQPCISQRNLAERLSVSLGKANYCLNALVKKGWIKAINFKNSQNKLAYSYILTPYGLEAKARLTVEYLRKKTQEYEELKTTLDVLQRELEAEGGLDRTQL